ncbi:hypothetical protein V496_03045 [Pseudogymnoascus sp. VKM F-4515 (FW-2607)]|nr:hypothetical protein V496_03045 [Pseudogymnoascus sp. VKM F-4515 (FW-2607)]
MNDLSTLLPPRHTYIHTCQPGSVVSPFESFGAGWLAGWLALECAARPEAAAFGGSKQAAGIHGIGDLEERNGLETVEEGKVKRKAAETSYQREHS